MVTGATGVVFEPNIGPRMPKLNSRALRVINQVPICNLGHLTMDQPVIGVTGVIFGPIWTPKARN